MGTPGSQPQTGATVLGKTQMGPRAGRTTRRPALQPPRLGLNKIQKWVKFYQEVCLFSFPHLLHTCSPSSDGHLEMPSSHISPSPDSDAPCQSPLRSLASANKITYLMLRLWELLTDKPISLPDKRCILSQTEVVFEQLASTMSHHHYAGR